MRVRNIFEEKELEEDSVVKEFLTTAVDGALKASVPDKKP